MFRRCLGCGSLGDLCVTRDFKKRSMVDFPRLQDDSVAVMLVTLVENCGNSIAAWSPAII